MEFDPRVDYEGERPQSVEEIKTIVLREGRMVKIGSHMEAKQEKEFIECLKENLGVFAWSVQDMPRIDPNFMCHCFFITPNMKPIAQKRQKLGEEKR